MAGVEYQVNQRGNIEAKLKQIQKNLSDLTPLMREIGAEVQSLTELTFVDSESPEGKKWATVKKRGKKKPPFKPLIDTSILRNSFTFLANKNGVEVGTNTKYAAVHQYGYKKIPQRNFLPINELPKGWVKSVETQMDKWVSLQIS